MKFKKYDNIKDFSNENLELLLEKEWLNNLMVGNCLEESTENWLEGWILANITNEENIELIMLYRKPWNMLLYSPTNNTSEDLYKFATEEIFKIDNNLNGVNAEKDIANKFAKYYCEISNKKAELDHPMRILVLNKLANANLNENVIFRNANRAEYEILEQHLKEFQKEALNREIDEKMLKENMEIYFKKGFYVLEIDGKIVSQAVTGRTLEKGACINEVYTPKEYRGKGYAYNLVYRISQKCLENGAEYCVLYTDDKNPISNHVYEKIGYKRMVDCEEIRFIEQ